MLQPIDFSSAKVIVEAGAGEGCITKEVLKRMRPDAVLYAFEVNKNFCTILNRIRDRRLHVVTDSAERIHDYVGIGGADYVVSGLPLVSLPPKVGTLVVTSVKASLKPQGVYIQFQYSLTSYKQFKQNFSQVKIHFTLLNIPPAFVYECVR